MTNPGNGTRGERTSMELQRLLDLVRAQLKHTRHEGQSAIDELTGLFTELFETVQRLERETGTDDRSSAADEQAARQQQLCRQAIGALQFYDRLWQRLGHAIDTLEACRSLTADIAPADDDHEAWSGFWSGIGIKYSLGVDRELLALVLAGASSEEALERIRQRTLAQDSIELF